MTSDDALRPWDVVIVPFPYSEQLAEKRRPALVVSNQELHRGGLVWVAMITGAGKPASRGDVAIRDLDRAGLSGDSIVRTSKLATLEPERILRRAGSLAGRETAAVRKAVAGFLA